MGRLAIAVWAIAGLPIIYLPESMWTRLWPRYFSVIKAKDKT
jgi:hypothetical protein